MIADRSRRSTIRGLLAVATILGANSCSEPVAFPDWSIPVAEGTPVIDYAPVPIEERVADIELIPEVTLGGNPDDPNQSFFTPTDIAVAGDGRIFVFERGNRRIQAFDAAGEYLSTISRGGQGPGEIDRGGDIVVVAGRLVRNGDAKLGVWTLGGEHLQDSMLGFGDQFDSISRLGEDRVLGRYSRANDDDTDTEVVVAASLDAELGTTFAEMTIPRRLDSIVDDTSITIVNLPGPTPAFATTRDGLVYVTQASEYQVHAFDAQASPRWALRTAWERTNVTQSDRERAVLRSVGDTPADSLAVQWPELNPALESVKGTQGGRALLVDGHGHLYVFPFVREPVEGRFPVDVYDADGERLFAGFIAINEWRDALGDYVYGLEARESDAEAVAVRYRLVEPF